MQDKLIEEAVALLRIGVHLHWSSVALLAVLLPLLSGFAGYIGSYLQERGKNLATKEDIAEITRKVEEVRAVFAKDEAEREQRYRLQLAALDKRLAVHQEAYIRWHRLWNAVHTDEVSSVVIDSQTWFHENCVYLGRDLATAFHRAIGAAFIHRDLLRAGGRVGQDVIQRNWDKLEQCGDMIMAAVNLPSLGPLPPTPHVDRDPA